MDDNAIGVIVAALAAKAVSVEIKPDIIAPQIFLHFSPIHEGNPDQIVALSKIVSAVHEAFLVAREDARDDEDD